MTTMTSYLHGVPSWVELATPDLAAAKAFYGRLLGWDCTEEASDDPGVTYVMARKDGRSAAGMMQLTEDMSSSGMPPTWTTYIKVDDVDATVGAVQPAGGSVLQPPVDVLDAGRMAVIADPAGAVVGLWQPNRHIGAEVVNEHGALTWNELVTDDPAAVAPFYEAVLGWRAEAVPMDEGEYTLFHVAGADRAIAGALPPTAGGMPNVWSVYLDVDDAASTVARAKELGGEILLGPTTMPGVGTMATLRDPQGAVFSVMTPEG